VCLDENKAILTRAFLQRNGLEVDFQASYAYADSISDLHLLEIVGHPVATYADERLRAVAMERGWRVFPGGDS
jgi:phosphoserine phosphatase